MPLALFFFFFVWLSIRAFGGDSFLSSCFIPSPFLLRWTRRIVSDGRYFDYVSGGESE